MIQPRTRPPLLIGLLSCLAACSRPADGGPGGATDDDVGSAEGSPGSQTDSESDSETSETGGTQGGWACGEGPSLCAERPINLSDTTKDGVEVQSALNVVIKDEGWPITWRIDGAESTELRLSVVGAEEFEVIQLYGVDECGHGGFASADCHGGFELQAPGHLESGDGRIDVEAPLRMVAHPDLGGGYVVSVSFDADADDNQGSLPAWVELDGLSHNVLDFSLGGSFGVTQDAGIYDSVWSLWANESTQILAHSGP